MVPLIFGPLTDPPIMGIILRIPSAVSPTAMAGSSSTFNSQIYTNSGHCCAVIVTENKRIIKLIENSVFIVKGLGVSLFYFRWAAIHSMMLTGFPFQTTGFLS